MARLKHRVRESQVPGRESQVPRRESQVPVGVGVFRRHHNISEYSGFFTRNCCLCSWIETLLVNDVITGINLSIVAAMKDVLY